MLLPILLHTAVNVSARLLLEPLVGQDSFLTVWCLITTAHLLETASLDRMDTRAARQEHHSAKASRAQ